MKPPSGEAGSTPDPPRARNTIQWRANLSLLLATLALLVAGASFYHTWNYNSSRGVVEALAPAGYAVVRGYATFPSDHFILPIEWNNDTGKSVLIRDLRLHLTPSWGDAQVFLLAGEYPEISDASLSVPYSHKNSFIVAAHSVELKVLMFHTEKWWDEDEALDYQFRFEPGMEYSAEVEFERNAE